MKKFSEFKPTKRIVEQEEVKATPAPVQQSADQQTEVKTEETGNKSEVSKFFSKLFESREMTHVYHLQITGEGSYAGHKALNKFYDEVLELIDDLIETYTGQYEIVENYETIDTDSTRTKDKIQYFNELQQFIKDNRYVALSKEDTHLQNIVDEIVALGYRTMYKLKNLK